MDRDIILTPIAQLKLDPSNARKHSQRNLDAIAASLEKFGQVRPIVVHRGTVIAGNGTVQAAKSIGWSDIAVIEVPDSWDADQAKAYALVDNRTAELAEWDEPVLAGQLLELDTAGWDLSALGFDVPADNDEPDLTEDEIPEPPSEPLSKIGQVWQVGSHRIACGDSTDATIWNRVTTGESVDICFTSPPYNAGKSESLSGNTHMGDNKYKTYNDAATQSSWLNLCNQVTSQAIQYCKYAFINLQMLAGNKQSFIEYLANQKMQINDIAIWDKGHAAPAMAVNVMNSRYEFVIIVSKDNNSRAINTGSFRGQVSNVITGIGPARKNEYSNIHAATFPLELPAWAITNFTSNNAKVIDPFAVTGTTLIAAARTGRIGYGIELDPAYVDVIIKRLETETGQTATLIGNP